MSKTWTDIEQQLDPGISDDDRNKIRQKFFHDEVLPKIDPSQYSVQATYQDFLKKTERPVLLQDRARKLGESIGHGITDTAAAAGLLELAGPLTGGIAEAAFGATRAAKIAANIGRGGLAFATYDAIQAKDGDRVNAALRGAAFGAVGEVAAGTLFGWGGEAAEKELPKATPKKKPFSADEMLPESFTAETSVPEPKLNRDARRALSSVPGTSEADQWEMMTAPDEIHAANHVADEAAEARKLGMTKGPMVMNSSKKGLQVALTDEAGQSTYIPIAKGKEADGIALIQQTLDKGGSLDWIESHPGSRRRANELARHFGAEAEDATATVRVQTEPGNFRAAPKPGLTPFEDVRGDIKEYPTQDSEDALKAGDIRHRIRQSRSHGGPGETVPNSEHVWFYDWANATAKKYGIKDKSHLGDLALSYFGDVRSTTGEFEPFENAVARFKDEHPEALGETTHGATGPEGSRVRWTFTGVHPNIPPGEILPGAPPGETGYLKPTPNEENIVFAQDGEIRVRPVGTTKLTSQPGDVGGYANGMRVLTKDATEGTIYHESIHQGIDHAGLESTIPQSAGTHLPTGMDLAKGIRSKFSTVYKSMSPTQLLNEAFAHAAEAVRMGDTNALEELGRMDTDPETVRGFVGNTAKGLLEGSYSKDTAPVRAFQRRMNDLVRRTSDAPSETLARAGNTGWKAWFDPEINQWVMQDGEGRETLKSSINEVWDQIHESDPSDHFPDVAHTAYFKGFKGPMVPTGLEPVEGSGTPEIEHIPFGLQSIAHATRPAMDWASGVQKVLNKHGLGDTIDFYGAMRGVESAARDASRVMDESALKRDGILKDVAKSSRADYGEVMSRPPTEWAAHADELGLSAEDLANIRDLDEWHPKLSETLQTLQRVRSVGGDLTRANGDPAIMDAIRNGELGYDDLNVGRVSQWVLRNDYHQTLGEAIDGLRDVSKQFKNNRDITSPINNYINYIRGVPDSSQKMLDGFYGGIEKGINGKIQSLNKNLPAGAQIPELSMGKSFWSTYRAIQYASGLGARVAVPLRDGFQAMFGMAAIGPKAFAEGLARLMTEEGRAEFEEAGAALHKRNVGEFFGDVSGDLPAEGKAGQFVNRAVDTLLAPSRIAHNFGRGIVYLGEKQQALREIIRYRNGEIDPIELANRTSAWFHDAPERSRLLGMAANEAFPVEQVADAFAKSANEATQFGGSPGSALRTGMGKLLGQYASWPMNHIEFTRKLVSRAMDNPAKGIPALGLWAGINYGAFAGAEALGIDATKWLFFSPAGYVAGPTFDLAQNVLAAPEESQKGRDARKAILEFPLEFVPTGVELKNVWDAVQSGDMSPVKLLGFRNLKEPQNQRDLEDWIQYESGFKRK